MWFLIGALVALVIGIAFAAIMLSMSHPMPNNRQNLQVPSTELGTTIPVIFGKRRISSPIVAYWGGLNISKHPINQGGKKM